VVLCSIEVVQFGLESSLLAGSVSRCNESGVFAQQILENKIRLDCFLCKIFLTVQKHYVIVLDSNVREQRTNQIYEEQIFQLTLFQVFVVGHFKPLQSLTDITAGL
jgi:hypothetical protein